MTYYRIQAKATAPESLLDPENWLALNWNGGQMDCRGCTDCEPVEADRRELGQTCRGTGEVDRARYGISACRDLDDLLDYATAVGMDLWSADMVIVKINGPASPDAAEDAHLGEVLILPSEILSVEPVTDEHIEHVFARGDALNQ